MSMCGADVSFAPTSLRAVIYARYSSDQQRATSIEDQIHACRAEIERRGWSCLQSYMDHALSGASTQRPGYQKLLEDARAGAFEVVVAEALDRLSRDQADTANLYKQLSFLGVRVVTLAEGAIDELHIGLKGTMNALYLKELAQKTRRGLAGRIREGRSGGGISYGYGLVPGETGALQVIEAEAEVVRRIFHAYAAGTSPKAIARHLNAEGIPGPRGQAWGQSTINGNRARGSGILANELYVGRRVWNRLSYLKDPATGKRVSRLNPPEQWICHDVPELRIVADDLWDAVQARRRALRSSRTADAGEPGYWDRRRPRYLLSGLAGCGACGGGFSMISATHLGCSTARNKGTCDNRLTIRRDALEEVILEALRHRLLDPELIKLFADAYIAEVNRLRGQADSERVRLERRQAEIERRLDRLMHLSLETENAGAPRRYAAEMHKLEAEQDAIEHRLTEAPPPRAPLIHPNMAEVYRRKVARLTDLLHDTDAREEAAQAIRSLIDRVVLHPVDGELRVELRGDIAEILHLCADAKKPLADIHQGLEAQAKLVAGAGFEPATFRL